MMVARQMNLLAAAGLVGGLVFIPVSLVGCSGGEPSDSPTPAATTPPDATPTAVPNVPTPTPDTGPEVTPTVPPNVLAEGNWLPSNQASLTTFGVDNVPDDPRQAPVAVFNFDQVSLLGSAAEATFRYQLTNLAFKITPGQLEEVVPVAAGADFYSPALITELPASFGNVSIPALQQDIVEAYGYLYSHYEPTGGCTAGCDSLDTLKGTSEYKTFTAKLLYLYQGLTADPEVGADFSAVMLARLQAGFTEAEIRAIASDAFEFERDLTIDEVGYSSPASGAAGKVSGTYVSGIRLMPEVLDLYDFFRRNGFDIWVIGNAPQVVLQAVTGASTGFSVNAENVVGVQVEREGRGQTVTLSILVKTGVSFPYGQGKVDTIDQLIGKDPLVVVGGTDEDAVMLSTYESSALRLVINRGLECPFADFYGMATTSSEAGEGDLLLQGLDENTGDFRPAQTSVLFGESSPATIPTSCEK